MDEIIFANGSVSVSLTAKVSGKERSDIMGTTIHPELSEKNKYWIERHRYYELKHFCLQYPIWKKAYLALDGLSKHPSDLAFSTSGNISDPTAKCAEARLFYSEKVGMIEQTAIATDATLYSYILKGITEGISYDHHRYPTPDLSYT